MEVEFVCYPDLGAVCDAAELGEWDIENIGAEPQRAKTIAFTSAYCEIEATYLVPAGSPLQSINDVDQSGIRIATKGRAAYGLWPKKICGMRNSLGLTVLMPLLMILLPKGLRCLQARRLEAATVT